MNLIQFYRLRGLESLGEVKLDLDHARQVFV